MNQNNYIQYETNNLRKALQWVDYRKNFKNDKYKIYVELT